MAEFLLELYSEELPSRMQLQQVEKLEKAFAERLLSEKLFSSSIQSFVTPQRMVIHINGLSITQEDTVTERRGPKVDAPEKAIEGFLRSTGLTLEQLVKRNTDKGEVYFAITKQEGKPTKEVLQTAVEEILPAINWSKSMRWGDHSIRWGRPLKNILCLFGGEVLPVKFGHLESNDRSHGHRFLAPESFSVTDFRQYTRELKRRFVILDTEDRKRIILEGAEKLCLSYSPSSPEFSKNSRGISKKHLEIPLESANADSGNDGACLTIISDDPLLTEVAGLVEWPEVLLGEIDPEYMDLPEEVLISAIRTHQKYFCLRDKNGAIAPYFLVVSNVAREEVLGIRGSKKIPNPSSLIPTPSLTNNCITTGNERVLRARLADSKFFQDQDRKKPLADYTADLNRVTFHASLGTLGDRVTRIQALAKFLAVWIPHASLEMIERAAFLSKSDLATEMVGEFPELQGIMGYYYAMGDGEPDEVAWAIREHYSPKGAEDGCPVRPTSVAVALAEKMDTLAGLFAIGEKPTGSKDPFALRRAALGIIRIILENKLSIPLNIVSEQAFKGYPKIQYDEGNDEGKKKLLHRKKKVKSKDVTSELRSFFGDRLKALLKSENIRHDLIVSVFDGKKEDDLMRVVQKVAALSRFLDTSDGVNLLAAYKRAANIVRIEEKKDGRSYSGNPARGLLEQKEEIEFFDRLQNVKPLLKTSLKDNDFEGAMELLSNLRKPIDAFFEEVKVNCEEQDIRKNRLRLLAQMRELLDEIADFSLIEG